MIIRNEKIGEALTVQNSVKCVTLSFMISGSKEHSLLRTISMKVKLTREADHSPPSSSEVKNGGAVQLLSHTSSDITGTRLILFS
jgi:hypothetical protein